MDFRRMALCFLLLSPASLWAAKPRHPSSRAQTHKQPAPLFSLTPAQEINSLISHMLAAWQIGDVALLRRYYANDVAVVSGLDQPVIQGLNNYLADYEAQRKSMQSGQIIRRNTYVRVQGKIAWASYQWEFSGVVDGRAADYRGHTTLIFERSDKTWLIVLNHTSLDAAPVSARLPAKPAGGN